ncbi:MAG TPA: hypothetical protein VLT45_25430 [Kofleriaceae bacterium]|nr:hypothetical protein [Kofleriaceae bacterium]
MILGGVLVLLAAVVLFVHWLRAGEPLALDQGLFACFTRWPGSLPYRDLFDSKPPLFLYSWSLAAAVPGDVPLSMWRLETLWLLGSMAATWWVVRRLAREVAGIAADGAGAAAAAALFIGLWCPAWGGYWSRAQAEELAVLPMMLAAGVAVGRREPSARRLIVLGALTGVLGLYKIPTMAVAAAWPMLWERRYAVKAAGWVALGIALPWAAIIAWFAAHGAFGDFVAGTFRYHRYNAQFIAPPWLPTIGTWARTIATGMPELLVLAAAGLVALPARARRFVAVWIGATALAVLLERQLAGYHYLLVVPGIAVAAGCGVGAIAARLRPRAVRTTPPGADTGVTMRRWPWAAVAVVALGLAVRGAIEWGHAYGPGLAYERGAISRDAYLASFERGSPAPEEAVAGWIREHVPPGEHILVWATAPGIYALADREPATRYPFHKILMTEAPLSRMIPGLDQRRAELLARVDRDRPAVIVVGRNDRNGFEPETSLESLVHWPELMTRVKTEYEMATQIDNYLVFRRR